MLYDVCVIGAGTMGSSSAYYLSKKENLSICLVGPGNYNLHYHLSLLSSWKWLIVVGIPLLKFISLAAQGNSAVLNRELK